MIESRWSRLQELIGAALDAPKEQRERLLEELAGGDPELLEEARALLSQKVDEGFLRPPVLGAAGAVLAEATARRGIGRRFGAYRAIGVIASGGMGTVYKAVRDDDAFERVVAVKVVSGLAEGRRGAGALERFERERRLLARLSHPNIAALLDGGVSEDGLPYLVLEYVAGEPINRFGPGCGRRGVELVRAVCAAVAHAHQNLVIHRDLKPGNILVTPEGTPKLLDFGISKLLDETAPPSVTRARALTPAYASPEQLLGEPVTTASDTYSLGVILYEVLTGRTPWGDEEPSAAEVMHRPLPPRPSSIAPGDRDLDAICVKALSLEPGERYASAAALGEDIDRYLAGRPVGARAPTLGYTVRKAVRRHRIASASIAAGVVAAIGFGVAVTWMAANLARERDRARRALGVAREINAFLGATLEAVDAGAAGGQTVTIGTMLDEASARIERDLRDRPETAGPLRITIAKAYENLGRMVDAGPHFEKGVAELRGAGPDGSAALADALESYASYQNSMGDWAGAQASVREAIGLRTAARAEPESILRLELQLGLLRRDEKGPEGGEALVMRALDGFRALGVRGAGRGAHCLELLGDIAKDRGDCGLAVERHAEAVAALRDLPEGPTDSLATALTELGEMSLACGDAPGAERILREAVGLSLKLHGGEHATPTTTYQMMALAAALEAEGRNDEADAQWTAALRIAAEGVPEVHYITAILREKYGLFLSRQKRFEGAVRQLSLSYNDCVALFGAAHASTRSVGEALAVALQGAGRGADADAWRARLGTAEAAPPCPPP